MKPSRIQGLVPVLGQFAEVARPEILKGHAAASCIASTWITIKVLGELGYRASPLQVQLSVGNDKYRQICDKIGPPKTLYQANEWYEQFGAHAVGVGFDPPKPGIGGHLIVVVEGYLVDASIDQVNDSSTLISAPAVHWGRADPAFLEKCKLSQRLDTHNLFIEYSHHPSSFDYKSSRDWSDNPETSVAIQRIVYIIRKLAV